MNQLIHKTQGLTSRNESFCYVLESYETQYITAILVTTTIVLLVTMFMGQDAKIDTLITH